MSWKYSMWLVAGALGAVCVAEAHIVKGSLSLKGGETLSAGSVVNVTWTQMFGHNDGKYRIRYSSDGGTNWTDVEASWQGPKGDNAAMTYPWTVPSTATTQGRLHVSMIRGGLTDADYNLNTTNFTVSGSSVIRGIGSDRGASLRFDAMTRNLNVSFALDKGTRVSVIAYDARGKALATMLDREYAAGSHSLSLFSNGLDATQALVFRLRLGDELISFP
jgi:hypothetical protein